VAALMLTLATSAAATRVGSAAVAVETGEGRVVYAGPVGPGGGLVGAVTAAGKMAS